MKLIGKINEAASIFTAVSLLNLAAFGQATTDNTKINQRDASQTEVTADQQPSSGSDMEITRMIRQDLMKHNDLSTYAHNIKIITMNGKVTLKGPVRSKKEVNTVLQSANSVAGASNVINQITVVPK